MLCDNQIGRLRWTWPIYIFYNCHFGNEIIYNTCNHTQQVHANTFLKSLSYDASPYLYDLEKTLWYTFWRFDKLNLKLKCIKTRSSLEYILLQLQLFAGIRVVCSEIARSQSNGSSGNFHHGETEKGLRQYELEVLWIEVQEVAWSRYLRYWRRSEHIRF